MKLSILEDKDSLVSLKYLFLNNLEMEMNKGMRLVKSNNSEEYNEKYAKVAYKILASSPFTSYSHICSVFSCTLDTLNTWLDTFSEFKKQVQLGLLKSEALARNLLLNLSTEPSSKCNTKLLTLLSSNIYNLEESSSIDIHLSKVQESYKDISDDNIVELYQEIMNV